MYSITERVIVALAKGDFSGAQESLDQGRGALDLNTLVSLSERHMIAPLILKRLSVLDLSEVLREQSAVYARHLRLIVGILDVSRRSELQHLSAAFARASIAFLLIKGYAIDKSPFRQMKDLDVLIHPEDLNAAFVTLQKAGYHYVGSGVLSEKEKQNVEQQLKWNNQFQFRSPHCGLTIEVHIALFERDRIRLENLSSLLARPDLFWERSEWDEELGCTVPSIEATLALLCVHSATKRSPAHNTYILRHSCDIVTVLRRGVDHHRFMYLCTTWDIAYYCYVALSLTVLSLETDEPQPLIDRLSPILTRRNRRLADIHCRCFRGLGNASQLHRLHYNLYMPFVIGGGPRRALAWYGRMIAPPRWKQEQRFNVSRYSRFIWLTYLYGPLLRIWRAVRLRTAEPHQHE